MSNTIEEVRTKQNNTKSVRAGHHQLNYVAGEVVRFPAIFKADVLELVNGDATTKDSVSNAFKVIIDALNEVYKPAVKLELKDYDFQSGKYSRDKPAETTQATPQVATAQAIAQVPQVATADATPKIPATPKPKVNINAQLVAYIKAQREIGSDFDTIRAELEKIGNTKEIIDAHFNSAYPIPN